MGCKISISDARRLGIVPGKNRKEPHYADVARAKGKQATQLKAWTKKQSKTGQGDSIG